MGMVEEVGTYLISQLSSWIIDPSVSPTTGNIFYTDLPINPPQAVGLYQFAGSPPQYTFGKILQWVNPRLQVLNRNPTIEGAFADAKSIYNALVPVIGVELSGTNYIIIQPAGEPQEYGPDPANNQRVITNYKVMKQPS